VAAKRGVQEPLVTAGARFALWAARDAIEPSATRPRAKYDDEI
jgi:hypothetical protein